MSSDTETLTKKIIKRKIKCKYLGCKKYFNPQDESYICCEDHQKLIFTYEKPDECPICLTTFEPKEEKGRITFIPLIPCHHWVCVNCVINSGKLECPICRQSVKLSEKDEQKCNKKALKINKEKERIQMEEDRRMAEQMQRELNQQNIGIAERRNVIQVVIPRREIPQVTLDNIDEMLQIINGLNDPIERHLFRRIILDQMQQRNIRDIEDDEDDEVEEEDN